MDTLKSPCGRTAGVYAAGVRSCLSKVLVSSGVTYPYSGCLRSLLLTANARTHGCDNVRAVNAAASDFPGRLVFYLERSTNLGGTTAVRPHTVESSFEADSASLPQLVTEEELAAARLIKIDVEGAEAAAVSGLVPILPWLRGDAELVIEVTPRLLAKQGRTVDDVLRPLRPDFTPTDWPTTTTPAATQPPCVDLRRRAVARACNGDD